MKRLSAALAVAALAVAAAPAGADQGAPGATFPEQPTPHIATGCSAVLANTGTGLANMSPGAVAITSGLITDACFGG